MNDIITAGAGGPGNSATASGDKIIATPFFDNQEKKGPNKIQVMESPGPTRPLRLEMDLTPGENLGSLKQQEEQEEQREGSKIPRYQHQLQLWEGVEAQAQHKVSDYFACFLPLRAKIIVVTSYSKFCVWCAG